MPRRVRAERQAGGPEVANSHAPQARGQGYGAAGPMSTRRATRAVNPVDLSAAVSAAATHAQAKRAGGAARSAA